MNCQKVKLYGSLTTKELQKHSSGPVGGAETGRQEESSFSESAAATHGTGGPTFPRSR